MMTRLRLTPAALAVGLLALVASLSACIPGPAGEVAVDHARQQIGQPYTSGGSSPETGFDCSGLTSYAWKQAGVTSIPRSSIDQYNWTERIGRDELAPGDLVFYGYDGRVGHVAIYAGNDTIIHARNSNYPVMENDINTYWTGNLIGYGRVPDHAMPD
ncbi:MAG: C40 family peptidase [Actinomycetota bacterium]|nr:C40 family peptidase [Actinomycetota bacterium]